MTGKIVFGDPDRYYLGGVEVAEADFRAEFPDLGFGPVGGTPLSGWPIYSNSSAVHPDTVGEAAALAASRGVPTEYLPTGEPVFRDRKHRREFLKAHGLRDRQGGYGDG